MTEPAASPSPAPDAPGDGQVLSVSDVTRLVKDLLEQSIHPVWVLGEVGNLTVHRSGHVYFTLKDDDTQLICVQFRGAAAARAMRLESGMQVEAFGKLSVFEPRGQYQLIVRYMRPKGIGNLQQQFEALKRRLQDEGLFDADRKRPIPKLPATVAVVTSPDGAALRDFLSVIRRRYAGMHIRIVPAAVQGAAAAREVADAIAQVNARQAADVIVVTRGGGSMEDLWAFNEEIVARAVAASAIPVISAVGHEVDFTICDFAADLRVPTPSAAAELVVASHADLTDRVRNLERRTLAHLRLTLGELRRRVDRAAGHYVFREPMNLVRLYQQRVDDASSRLGYVLERRVRVTADRVKGADTRLRLLDPRAVLGRGYAILLDAARKPVKAAAQVRPGDPIHAVLHRGDLDLTVDAVHDAGADRPPADTAK